MKYQNAHAILPKELVKELQKYVQGGYLYVPTTKERRKAWGELSGYKEELRQRNASIIREFQKGYSMKHLAEKYHLSIHAIKKIIYQ